MSKKKYRVLFPQWFESERSMYNPGTIIEISGEKAKILLARKEIEPFVPEKEETKVEKGDK